MFVAAGRASGDSFASFDVPAWAWVALVGAIVAMLVVDLLLVHRTPHVISIKEASIESAIWISIGLAFGVVLTGIGAAVDHAGSRFTNLMVAAGANERYLSGSYDSNLQVALWFRCSPPPTAVFP